MDGVAQSRTRLKQLSSSSSSIGKIVLIWGRKIQNSFEEDITMLQGCFENEDLIHVKSENNALIHLINIRY